MTLWKRLKYLSPSYRQAQEREMREEMESLAAIAGRRELGNLTLAAENARAVWGWSWLAGIWGDVRYALRTLRRQPNFTAVATISLALGIGANAAIFGLMDAVLWRKLPVADPDRLVMLGTDSRSYFVYSGLAAHAGEVMESVIATTGSSPRRLDPGAGPQQGGVELVTGNYFTTLGVRAALGRAILPDDDRRSDPAPVALLSYDYWQRAFAGDRAAVGRSLRVEKARYTIVGVAPPGFFGLTVGEAPDVWLPMAMAGSVVPGPNPLDQRNYNSLFLLGRLRPGVSPQQAATALTPVDIQIELERNGPPATEAARRELYESRLELTPAARGMSFLEYRFAMPLRVVFWMVAAGLLLACVNVMSLQFARADERRRELTVRLAIGASRFRIVRQLLTESLVIALASGALGLAIRQPIAAGLTSLISAGQAPVRLDLRTNLAVLLFIVGISLGVALLSGLVPALRATRRDLQPALQQASRATTAAPVRRALGRAVTAAQLALSMVLIAAACLFAFSLHQLRQFDSGMNRRNLLVIDLDPADSGYQDAHAIDLNMRLRGRMLAVPGIAAVSFSQNGLFSGRNSDTRFEADGFHNRKPRAHIGVFDMVGPGFFTALGARLIAGRDFNERDDQSAPSAVIVNREFARRVFEDRNPVGQNLYLAEDETHYKPYRIIGVVQNVRNDVRRAQPLFYECQLQTRIEVMSTRFLVRTRQAPEAAISGLRAAIRAEDASLEIGRIDTADALLDSTLDTDRLMAALAWGFGVLAIVLAAVGIYGLLSYDVTRRTGEIGIRMALGAFQRDIMWLVLREVALLCAAGLTIGAVAALALARLVEGMVFGLKAGDPRVEAGAAVILAAVAVVAAWFPARRAARLDPMAALRNE